MDIDMHLQLEPIGYVSNNRKEIQDDYWGDAISTLKINTVKYGNDCLKGLDTFSHLEVIYYMHRLDINDVYTGSRYPRNNPAFPKIGIFSQRMKNRPNLLGLSRCNIIDVKSDILIVRGLDAIDGSPILDIKPYMKQFGPIGEILQPKWVDEVMRDYYKK